MKDIERLREIIKIADKLKWITPSQVSYPLMQLSEVEKCMLAMVDDFELERMRDWELETDTGRTIPEADTAVIDLLTGRSKPASGDLEAPSGAGEKGRL